MAANPHPDHITAEYWWFIEQLQALEPLDTVFAGAWGRAKPGYHCDYWMLVNTPAWKNDYSVRLPEDKVGGTPLEQFGAATDWTFKSAQRGDFSNIRKYGARVALAFANRDPRLRGWREVLIQADADKAPEGFDFVTWTTRTPDSTHEWHGHFSCLRQFLRTLSVFKAMLSILRGETLAQWLAQGDDMFFFQDEFQGAGRLNGCTYEYAPNYETLLKWKAAWPGVIERKVKSADLVAGVYGTPIGNSGPAPTPGPSDGVTAEQATEIARTEISRSRVTPQE